MVSAQLHARTRSERAFTRWRPEHGLLERELRKRSSLSEAIRQGFLERGVDELTSTLAADIAASVFNVGLSRWLDQDGGPPLAEILQDTLDAVGVLATGSAETSQS